MMESNRHRAASHQARLSCSTDHYDAIDDLHDALNVGDDLLCQLLLMEGVNMPFKHQHASFGGAGDAPQCCVGACT